MCIAVGVRMAKGSRTARDAVLVNTARRGEAASFAALAMGSSEEKCRQCVVPRSGRRGRAVEAGLQDQILRAKRVTHV